jgi:hypothetical protein
VLLLRGDTEAGAGLLILLFISLGGLVASTEDR